MELAGAILADFALDRPLLRRTLRRLARWLKPNAAGGVKSVGGARGGTIEGSRLMSSMINVGQLLRTRIQHPPHTALTAADRRHLQDVERIAEALARQAGAPAEEWPFFVEPAESLIRLSQRWTNGC